jgi:uncharacterized membrane protein YfcA
MEMISFLQLFTTIFLLSIVQSIFGVGLLVFGTPTLLLMGFTFDTTLSCLLPCSLCVSTLQSYTQRDEVEIKSEFLLACLPAVCAGLIVVLASHALNLKPYVGSLLIISAILRISPALKEKFQQTSRRYKVPSLTIIGFLHGLTNMGGGLLSIFVSMLYSDKEKIRANIAFGYLLMASCQLTILALTGRFVFSSIIPVLAFVAGTTYMSIGNRTFKAQYNMS